MLIHKAEQPAGLISIENILNRLDSYWLLCTFPGGKGVFSFIGSSHTKSRPESQQSTQLRSNLLYV